jgi:hypothetical protein
LGFSVEPTDSPGIAVFALEGFTDGIDLAFPHAGNFSGELIKCVLVTDLPVIMADRAETLKKLVGVFPRLLAPDVTDVMNFKSLASFGVGHVAFLASESALFNNLYAAAKPTGVSEFFGVSKR